MLLTASLLVAGLTLAPFSIPQGPQGDDRDPLPELDGEITARELRHHVAYLASDELRGRAAGTPDAVRAARYLARALEQAGVAPAGDDGTFLQAIPLVRWVHNGPPVLEVELADGTKWTAQAGVDFSFSVRGEPSPTTALPVRTVASLADLPDAPDSGEAVFLDGSRRERENWLSARGIADTSGWGLSIRTGSSKSGEPSRTPRGRMRTPVDGGDPSDTVTLRGELRRQLLDGEIASLELRYDAERSEITDYNVIGRIDGIGTSDAPGLAEETIVFSAHYDHIGVVRGGHSGGNGDDGGEDIIYNGADDDASGTASVLELAQAFAARDKPARTLIFFLAAGEEVGLIGTKYYLEHPAVPLDRTVCNLNFEMIGRPDELAGGFGKLWLSGFERTTLGERFQEAGLAVVADPRLDQNFFQRSDNYAFAVRGIVGQTLSSYNLHADYHRVTDEVDTLDFAHMESAMRAAFAASIFLADGSLRPEWLPGGMPNPR